MSSRNWCFTLNNYDADDERVLCELGSSGRVVYLVFGRELGATGTRHLQGYVRFPNAKVLASVKSLVSTRGHYEIARGTPLQASTYCKKDGDFEEFGQPPVGGGKRSDLDEFIIWVKSLEHRPPQAELVVRFPSLWLRSGARLWDIIDANIAKPSLIPETVDLRAWQEDLISALEEPVSDRNVDFFVDPVGNTGKSFMTRYLLSTRDDVQVLRVGKRDDLAHAIDPSKKVFLVDVPRSQMEYLQYSILEMLKDRTIFSPKYHSATKILSTVPYVAVFCNEEPDMTKLSEDRYVMHYI